MTGSDTKLLKLIILCSLSAYDLFLPCFKMSFVCQTEKKPQTLNYFGCRLCSHLQSTLKGATETIAHKGNAKTRKIINKSIFTESVGKEIDSLGVTTIKRYFEKKFTIRSV